ncbi:helix-turn-helix domain-containing protein [Chryseobacterium sp. GP-SGM7]|uniref:helix-turn-helix domain-containing protein n=1 Tax=Chryseobacterium sp. GP-SGM7 TaxID=3411323 RepID=UPI003B927BD7
MNKSTPNYKLIFSDIIDKKYPDKKDCCKKILEKSSLNNLDIIRLNKLIFGTIDKQTETFNQKHRAYSTSDITEIIQYQKKTGLNNTQVSLYFKLSRNTLSKWKKIFPA